VDIHGRLKRIREYRGLSQADVARLLGVSKQAWGRKERGEIDGFGPADFELLLRETEIDARWLFGQMEDAPIEKADLRTAAPQSNYTDLVNQISELKRMYTPTDDDPLVEKVRVSAPLREIVDQIKNLEGGKLAEIKAMLFAYLYSADKKGEERKAGSA